MDIQSAVEFDLFHKEPPWIYGGNLAVYKAKIFPVKAHLAVKQQYLKKLVGDSQFALNFYKEWLSWIPEQEDNFCLSGQCGIWTLEYEQVTAMTTRLVDPKIKTRLSSQPQHSSKTNIKKDLAT